MARYEQFRVANRRANPFRHRANDLESFSRRLGLHRDSKLGDDVRQRHVLQLQSPMAVIELAPARVGVPVSRGTLTSE